MNPKHRPIVVWLYALCLAILVMIAIGGITRLTESGLSIVKWEPLLGAKPPMSEVEWQAKFDEYKAYPEYRVLKPDMTLVEFKTGAARDADARQLASYVEGMRRLLPDTAVEGRIIRLDE